MSSAYFPTNMRKQSGGGYSNHSSLQNVKYVSWKGTGLYSNPVGVTATHIRPLTNKDYGNVFPTGFGLPRPIKHYRKGTVIPINFMDPQFQSENQIQSQSGNLLTKDIEYNVNRAVKSSLSSSLGGGNGGTGLISQMMDMPGSFIVKDNGLSSESLTGNLEVGLEANIDTDGLNLDKECSNCNGVGIVSSWMPINNLTEKPQVNVTNGLLCCNQQKKAYQRMLPSNTNVPKDYYQTTYMLLQNRCQTFKQRQFNFVTGPVDKEVMKLFQAYPFVTAKIIEFSKPGDPLSIFNYYVAQCNPNFTVQKGVEIGFMNSIAKSLLDAGYITKEEYDALVAGTVPLNVQAFISSLQTILTKEQYEVVIDYLYQLAANPYNGNVVSGPSNPKGCSQVYYKPNNPQFAQQGGVSSSTRLLKLNVDTINTAAYSQRKYKSNPPNTATAIQYGFNPNTPFIYKDKAPTCQAQTFSGNPFFFQGEHQNKRICASVK